MKRTLLAVLLVLPSVVSVGAQEQTTEKPKAPAETASAPRETGQAVNIKVDLTITEQNGTAPVTTKVVSILAADNNTGRIRSYNPVGGARAGELNVDVRPRLIQNDRVQLAVTVEYRPQSPAATETVPPGLSESLTVFLQDGKPLVVSQSADPNSDRKVRLEARATVLR